MAPETAKAVYSPKLCPARAAGWGGGVVAFSRHASRQARLTAKIAGCEYSVLSSSLAGPWNISSVRDIPRISLASFNSFLAAGDAL